MFYSLFSNVKSPISVLALKRLCIFYFRVLLNVYVLPTSKETFMNNIVNLNIFIFKCFVPSRPSKSSTLLRFFFIKRVIEQTFFGAIVYYM